MSKTVVFVACPYTLFPLDDYKAVFKEISKSYDVSFRFADEQITNQHILDKITGYIREASFSLFDITGWNPNVSLEMGIAIGLAKRYFVLWNSKLEQRSDVPSDIRGIDRIQYVSNSELEAKLIILLKQELPTPGSSSDSAFETLKAKIMVSLTDNPGHKVAELAQAVGDDKALVQSIVRAMVGSGELKTRGAKKGMTYYKAGTDMRTVRR